MARYETTDYDRLQRLAELCFAMLMIRMRVKFRDRRAG